jgi:CRP/FNR family transcriptional regulator
LATAFAQAVGKTVVPLVAPPAAGGASFRALFSGRPTETLAGKGVLFWEGDRAEHLFEIVSGCLRLYKLMPDGRRAIIGFVFSGEILGASFLDHNLFTAEAVGEVRLRRSPRTQMLAAFARNPALSREVLAMACDELSAAQNQMLLLARKTAPERIASFLLAVAKRMSRDGAPVREVELPMARVDIADFLGLTVETVSRVLTRLKSEGVIALSSPHLVSLRQMAGLYRLAGGYETEPVTHLPVQRTVRSAAWPS